MTVFGEAAERVRSGADHRVEARALIAEMTLAEKLGCLDGDVDFWPGHIDMVSGGYYAHAWPAAAVERLGVPGIWFADGPRGCVINPSTAFPVSMARGATFDPELEERIGEAIGAELAIHGATFTAAVCLNLLRHPAWGRAQETYGEDPHHVGEMAAALARGLQNHVMACMKHFALNSMENARFSVDVTADERALHEVYLPHFKRVADEGVASTMSAYNSVNGEWCGDSPTLLTDVLRSEWSWDGFVITDFLFGLRDPIGSVGAGCDIEMPFRQQRELVLAEAVRDGLLAEETVDAAVENIVATLLRFGPVIDEKPDPARLEGAAHRALAREASAASMVLLSNDGLLPLSAESKRAAGSKLDSVAVLGHLADTVNLGDGGSSDVHPTEVVTPLAGLRNALPQVAITHHDSDVSIARDADAVIVVVGYTSADEGEFIGDALHEVAHLLPPRPERSASAPEPEPAREETNDEPAATPEIDPHGEPESTFAPGGDRRSLRLSEADEALIAQACATSDRVVVAVMGGSAVVMPWIDEPAAVLQIWYPGAEGGTALADVLLGDAEPGGRLPFAQPVDERDLVEFDPDASAATYGLLHGQWHLDQMGTAAARPFGFGLGYTTFDLSFDELRTDGGELTAIVTASNAGARDGSTVVFAFATVHGSAFERPHRRLVGFSRIGISAGESLETSISLDLTQLHVRNNGEWLDERGDYEISIGLSADPAGLQSHTVNRAGLRSVAPSQRRHQRTPRGSRP